MKHTVLTQVAISTLALALAGGACAQSKTTPPTTPPMQGAAGRAKPLVLPRPGTADVGVSDLVGAAFRQWLTRAAGYQHTPETDRADRVSVLIDAGKCSEARRLADAEGDVLMAIKVPQVCELKRKGLL